MGTKNCRGKLHNTLCSSLPHKRNYTHRDYQLLFLKSHLKIFCSDVALEWNSSTFCSVCLGLSMFPLSMLSEEIIRLLCTDMWMIHDFTMIKYVWSDVLKYATQKILEASHLVTVYSRACWLPQARNTSSGHGESGLRGLWSAPVSHYLLSKTC